MLRIANLPHQERLLLLKFVCSFAWADLEVGPRERAFVARLFEQAELPAADAAEVRRWLEDPPSPDEVDPARIPRAHRKLFLEAARGVLGADRDLTEEERDMLRTFEDLLR